ncbi:serine/threonine-protein kinase, partial [Microbacterium sp. SD291]|uniref:serine/threonine-protein kinase n=1 Tax=Microbacterium sp. SD291 TaxID=2782007 RepID=UPI001A956577
MQTQEAPPTEALLDGRYRLLGCVGRGGMASVYRAEDTLLERTVAVKLIRHDPDARFSADRAQSEKALLASLNHPALVTLFDARLEPGSAQYLVMEFVDGPTLAGRLTRGPMPSGELAQIAGDLADALDAVHSAGIIHRDVKPSNVLLTPPKSETGRWGAKLADFGIACALDTSPMTAPGVILGTAAYMAPEQLRNDELGPAADIYALGLILLEALTGRPAYPVSSSIESALVRLSVSPTIPESLGPAWSRLLSLMTRTDPAERP